jgi:hypothetical protein
MSRTVTNQALGALAGFDSREVLRMHLAASVMAHPRNQSPPNDLNAMVVKALAMADEIISVVDAGG